jgi:hypothetical protein
MIHMLYFTCQCCQALKFQNNVQRYDASHQNVSELALFFILNVCWLFPSLGNWAGFAAIFW